MFWKDSQQNMLWKTCIFMLSKFLSSTRSYARLPLYTSIEEEKKEGLKGKGDPASLYLFPLAHDMQKVLSCIHSHLFLTTNL